jgi:ATP-binding cassette subfamily B protein
LPFFAPYRVALAGTLVLLLLSTLSMLVIPPALHRALDHGLNAGTGGPWYSAHRFAALYAVAVLYAALSSIRLYANWWFAEHVLMDVRTAVHRNIMRLDPAYLESLRTGDLLSRLSANITVLEGFLTSALPSVLRTTLSFFGSLVMLFLTNGKLTVIIFLLVPVVVVPVLWIGRRVRRLSRLALDRLGHANALAEETFNSMQTVHAFGLEGTRSEGYEGAQSSAVRASLDRTQMRALMNFVAMTTFLTTVALVLRAAAGYVSDATMTVGQLGQFLLYSAILTASAGGLSEIIGEFQRSAGAIDPIVELLSAKSRLQEPGRPARLSSAVAARIRFEHVVFRYPTRPQIPALDDFTLSIESGETIALVGPSGAGKSTVLRLLLRFYDPDHGRVLINETELQAAGTAAVRAAIGLVPQETALFNLSIRENIRYGRPAASDAEVEHAARAANAEAFIRKLPDGYDTAIGERGTRLSGGQRQCIAIARAILKDAPVLLLDEATSSLDSESERLVEQGLMKLMDGRTTLIIAHRLSTVLRANRIVLMNQGRILGAGSHEQLVAQHPIYAKLAALQFGRHKAGTSALAAESPVSTS